MEVDTTRPPAPASAQAPFMPSSLVTASVGGQPAGGGEAEFTADDLAAADQLVQLSVSGGDEEDQCCSSSARSVNNAAENEDDDDDEEEDAAGLRRGVVDRRARKRYRLVSELYAATKQVKAVGAGAGGGGGSIRKRN